HPGATLNLDRVPAGPARDAALALQASPAAVDQNTARRLADGTLPVYYIEDLAHARDEADVLRNQGLSATDWMVLVHPTTGTSMLIQRNADGFQQDGLFGLRSSSVDAWRIIMVHEVNHAVNHDSATSSDGFDRFKAEFRAYWVSDYGRIADLDARARACREH